MNLQCKLGVIIIKKVIEISKIMFSKFKLKLKNLKKEIDFTVAER
ncbi:hypothetical protein [Clostridium gasigenes]|nr:hypothetical protein [Clostridium gasigenes]